MPPDYSLSPFLSIPFLSRGGYQRTRSTGLYGTVNGDRGSRSSSSARKMWATFSLYDRHRGWTALEKDCIRWMILEIRSTMVMRLSPGFFWQPGGIVPRMRIGVFVPARLY